MQSKFINIIYILVFLTLPVVAQVPQELPAPYGSTTAKNYVRTFKVMAPLTQPSLLSAQPLKDVQQATQYLDGAGRPIQSVLKEGSMITNQVATDLVNAIIYDAMGRETYKYLPFPSGSNTGAFKGDPFLQQANFYNNLLNGQQGETNLGPDQLNWAYAKNNYEASPLGRLQSSYAAGTAWVGSEGAAKRNVSQQYWLNTSVDGVRIWTVTENTGPFGSYNVAGTYGPGELFKNVTTDEQGMQVIEFKDKEGLLVLKKVQATYMNDTGSGIGYTGWLCTYYIYDTYNRLRGVVQPAGVEALNTNGWSLTPELLKDQCFRFTYDKYGRMNQKQLPGAAVAYMLYDQRDRLVLSQDGNLRANGKWLFYGYDDLDRRVMTGLFSTNVMKDLLATQLDNMTAFTGVTDKIAGQQPYSFPATVDMANMEILTRTFYDNYDWATRYGADAANYGNFDNNDATKFLPASDGSWPYPQALTQSVATAGMITGSWDNAAGGLTTSLIYDEKGRVIQVKSRNHTGGNDVLTTQYSYAGKPLKKLQVQRKAGIPAYINKILTSYDYDDLGRLITLRKSVESGINGDFITTPDVTIARYEYDALGRLKTKSLGERQDDNNAYTGQPVETLNYTYNVRGWLLGVNRLEMLGANGAGGNHYFGYELGYDNRNNTSGRNFTYLQYNGNIAGMIWKSSTDGIRRRYDFTYDEVSRLLIAGFEQNNDDGSWGNAQLDYSLQLGELSVPNTAYDANGNIKRMIRFGVDAGVLKAIDALTYSYLPGTNKLKKITDDAVVNENLGDFKDTYKNDDYGYDLNGNLITDMNKGLRGAIGADLTSGGAVAYNYLNLPVQAVFKDQNDNLRGTVSYLYDNSGKKLRKTVEDRTESSKTITTTTNYLGGLVYESKVTVPADAGNPDYTDKLLFISHEEGRIRYTAPTYSFDYFIKDYQENVRMVLSAKEQLDLYPIASLETSSASSSSSDLALTKLYYQVNEGKLTDRKLIAHLPDYPNNNGIPTRQDSTMADKKSQVLYKLMATGDKAATGLGITLKVTGGDKISLFGKSFYSDPGGNSNNYTVPVASVLESLFGDAVLAGKGIAAAVDPLNGVKSGLLDFLNNANRNNAVTRVPRAALNWVLFDDQFKMVNSGTGFKKVSKADALEDLTQLNIVMPRSGYLYVYCSNESTTPVYFDNIQVAQVRSRVLEEAHYYPFGVLMEGISGKGAGVMENRYKYNGKEKQDKEFGVGSGLEWYDYGSRVYDPQIGRWNHIDPLAEKFMPVSPYSFTSNNPVLFKDQDGKEVIPMPGFVSSSLYAMYLKLSTSNSVYKAYLEPFLKDGTKTMNYSLNVGYQKAPGDKGLATTVPKDWNLDLKMSNDKQVLALNTVSTFWEANESKAITVNGVTKTLGLNDVGKALVLLHEGAHAYLQHIGGNLFEGGSDEFKVKDSRAGGEHEMIGESYQKDILDGLLELKKAGGITMSDENLRKLSFYSLQFTDEFDKEFGLDSSTRGTETYRLAVLNVYNNILDPLIYTIGQ